MTLPAQVSEFVDRAGAFFADSLGFPPVAGRTLAYLAVSTPAEQTIASLAEALLASRSAITQAVTLLNQRGLARRFRARGQRVDYVVVNLDISQFARELDGSTYAYQAALVAQAAEIVEKDGAGRNSALLELHDFYRFLSERLPNLKEEWVALGSQRQELKSESGQALDEGAPEN